MLDDVEQRLGQIQVAEQGHEGAQRPAQELGEGSQVEGHDPHLLDVLERCVAPRLLFTVITDRGEINDRLSEGGPVGKWVGSGGQVVNGLYWRR